MNCLLNALMNVGNAHTIYTLKLLLNLSIWGPHFLQRTPSKFLATGLLHHILPDQSQIPSSGPVSWFFSVCWHNWSGNPNEPYAVVTDSDEQRGSVAGGTHVLGASSAACSLFLLLLAGTIQYVWAIGMHYYLCNNVTILIRLTDLPLHSI